MKSKKGEPNGGNGGVTLLPLFRAIQTWVGGFALQTQHALMASIAFLKAVEEAGLPIDSDRELFAALKTYGEVVRYHRPLPGLDMYGR